ncbi:addiction module protein [Candidatus Omnitrophota bacterium]
MSTIDIREEIKRLNVTERISLAEEIWDSIAENQEPIPVTQAQKDELDKRLESFSSSPETGSSWQDVKNRIEKV